MLKSSTNLFSRLSIRIAPMLLAFIITIAASPVNSMTSVLGFNSTIVPILQLLLDEDLDPNLPIADAGADSFNMLGELVQLDGSNSSDPNSLPITFLWSTISQPAASSAALDSFDIANPQFTLDVPGAYVFQLVVNNGNDDSPPDTVTIRNLNHLPIADAGENRIELLNLPVTLDGGNSSDIDTDPLTFAWVFAETPNGSVATLDDASAEMPSFTPDIAGNYVLELVVNDGQEDSDPDQIEVLAGAVLTFNIDDTFFGLDRQTSGTLSLNFPSPEQGITVSLAVNEAIIGLTQTEIQFDEGETEKPLTLTGLAAGQSDLSASATNVVGDTISVEVSAALISVSEIEPLSPTATRSVAISLSDAAPAGGVTINLEILDELIATIAPAQLFIAAGQFVPASNPQITGGALGTTTLRATAAGFAPDLRDVTVALAANFDPENLDVPETLTREIVLQLDAPAPTGGVVFNIMASGPGELIVQNSVPIAEGQLQSLPIVLTGVTEGNVSLVATAPRFIDTEAQITVVDAPDTFLTRTASTSLFAEPVVGLDLQLTGRLRLEILPTSAVDVHVSVPADSGVLLSSNANTVGSATLIFEDVLSTQAGSVVIQGTELGDNVPLTIEVFNANTFDLAGYEPRLSTIDVDPSGVFVSSSDFSITTFTTNRTVIVSSALLFDDETPGSQGQFRESQRVRAGDGIEVSMQAANPGVIALPDGGTGTLTIAGNSNLGTIAVTPVANGSSTVSIASQPTGFSQPSNRTDSVDVTVIAPEAFIIGTGSSSHRVEAIVGLDLQDQYRVRLETLPPGPVDVRVTVPAASGVLLSNSTTSIGGNQLFFEDITSTQTASFQIQGTAIGDDVPVTVEVFEANSTTPAGYNELLSTVDIDPSGIFVNSSDYSTTTFSNDRTIQVAIGVLHDAENPTQLNRLRQTQRLRGGIDLTVPMVVDDVAVAQLPAGANDDLIINGGNSSGGITVEPLGAGQAVISVDTLPLNFTVPIGRDDNVVANVTAPNAFLRSTGSASHLPEAIVGIDLQSPHFVRLAVTPPTPVDIRISVPVASGVLLSADPLLAGGTELVFEDISVSIQTPTFHIQGITIGDDVPFTVEVFDANTTAPAGFNSLASTVDVDPSGTYINTNDFETTTFSSNSTIQLRSALLFDDEIPGVEGRRRTDQRVRGGAALAIPLLISDDTVAVLPSGATDIVNLSANSLSGTIELDPLTAGETNLAITAQPNGNFTLPSDRNGDIDVTVTAPNINYNVSAVNVGDELQTPILITLETAPPNPVDLTVEVISSAVALVSADGSSAGSASVTFSNVSNTSVGTVFVQGLTQDTATQLKASAPGYSDESIDINVLDSGFRLTGTTSNISAGGTRNFTIGASRLNANGTFGGNQAVRGGASFDIEVTSSSPAIGTVTSPVTIADGVINGQTTFTAVAAGTTTVSITQPVDFSPPVGATELEVTVAPAP